MEQYPSIDQSSDIERLAQWASYVVRLREDDIGDFTNLEQIFMRGRKVGKIPASSSDISGDRIGDFNYNASYLYICVDNGGTLAWRRTALSSF